MAQPAVSPLSGERLSPTQHAAKADMRRRLSRRRRLMGFALVFFLFVVVSFVVPVRFIPGLRSLAGLMGWSVEDMPSFSFGRALLTWTMKDGTNRTAGEGDFAVFNQKNPRLVSENARSGLFNLRQLNASLRKQGLPAEAVAGLYRGSQDGNDRAAVNRPVTDWSQDAARAAARRKQEEVYFGEDADLAARAAHTAADTARGSSDSTKFVPKLKQFSGVVPPSSTDWLGLAADKATLRALKNVGDEVDKGNGVSSAALTSMNGGFKNKELDRAFRELSTIWIFSNAANKAQQLMLKKQLASAGYMAMDMPKKVFDSFGESSGLRMDGSEMVMNFETEEERLEKEKKCRDLGKKTDQNLKGLFESTDEAVTVIINNVPKTCDSGAMNTWKGALTQATADCNQIKDTIAPMQQQCGAKLTREGNCRSERLETYTRELPEACDELAAAQAAYDSCIAADVGPCDTQEANRDAAQNKVNATVNGLTPEEVEYPFSGDGDFFPASDSATSLEKDLSNL